MAVPLRPYPPVIKIEILTIFDQKIIPANNYLAFGEMEIQYICIHTDKYLVKLNLIWLQAATKRT